MKKSAVRYYTYIEWQRKKKAAQREAIVNRLTIFFCLGVVLLTLLLVAAVKLW